jgi:hypothetical protein
MSLDEVFAMMYGSEGSKLVPDSKVSYNSLSDSDIEDCPAL